MDWLLHSFVGWLPHSGDFNSMKRFTGEKSQVAAPGDALISIIGTFFPKFPWQVSPPKSHRPTNPKPQAAVEESRRGIGEETSWTTSDQPHHFLDFRISTWDLTDFYVEFQDLQKIFIWFHRNVSVVELSHGISERKSRDLLELPVEKHIATWFCQTSPNETMSSIGIFSG